MGLESVELMMEFEDEFELSIPDVEAETMLTPGDTLRYIVAQLSERRPVGRCVSASSFYRLRRTLAHRCGTARRDVRPSSRIGDVLRKPHERNQWRQIAAEAGLRKPPFRLFSHRSHQFPTPAITIRELINDAPLPSFYLPTGQVDEEAVWLKIRSIVSEQLGIAENDIRRDSRYVQDLGAG